ncbi:MAG: Hsp20/alpha crystallin family protein [Thermodesulfobacteriota bacterium]
MRLKVWEPYRSFRPFQRNVGRFFNEFELGLEPTEGLDDNTWTPKVDIYETDSSYVLSAELPGLTKEQINIDVNDNTLTINGEKRFEEKVEKDNYVRVERNYGSFSRSFSLSDDVNPEGITASYKEGVLELTLLKKEEAKPKEIKVEIN